MCCPGLIVATTGGKMVTEKVVLCSSVVSEGMGAMAMD